MFNKEFMDTAIFQKRYSDDPDTQVGCTIGVGKWIYGTGFNHMPESSQVLFPLCRHEDVVQSKYPYIIHAEMDAVTKMMKEHIYDEEGYDAYVTLFPCSNCAKLLIQTGVKTVYYIEDKYADRPDFIASRKLLEGCGVKLIQVKEVENA